jgi:hypothetical protein
MKCSLFTISHSRSHSSSLTYLISYVMAPSLMHLVQATEQNLPPGTFSYSYIALLQELQFISENPIAADSFVFPYTLIDLSLH